MLSLVILLVQVGTEVYLNPDNIQAIYPCGNIGLQKTCVDVEGHILESDWSIGRIYKTLEEARMETVLEVKKEEKHDKDSGN